MSGSRPAWRSEAGGGQARTPALPGTCSKAGWPLMNDWRERSSEEREAARRERERRRLERESAVEQLPSGMPELDGDEPFDDHDDEVPAGTRRVSWLHRTPTKPRRPARPRRPSRSHSRLGRIIALISLVLGAIVIWFLVELFQPFHGDGHGSATVTIPPHSSSSTVGDELEHDGVIASGFFFELRATLAGERSKLRSGTYHLKLGMSYGAVLKVLTTPPPPIPTTEITIVPGRTRAQISALLRRQGVHGSYSADTRRSHLLDPTRYRAPHGTPSLEGFLFPDTYQLR